VISAKGVLAIGTVEENRLVSTTGPMPTLVVGRGLNNGNGIMRDVTGTASVLRLELDGDGGAEQQISIWTPDAELTSLDGLSVTLDGGNVVSITVDTSAVDPGMSLRESPATLAAHDEPVLETSIPCGTAGFVTGPVGSGTIHREYRISPVEITNVSLVELSPANKGDRFFRAFRVGIDSGVPFRPDPNFDSIQGSPTELGWLGGQARFPRPQARYCVKVEALSLTSGSIESVETCVADDGRDWSAKIPARPEQIDSDLVQCSQPPASLVARHCALWRDVPSGTKVDCSAYSPADLDAALATPVDLEALFAPSAVDGEAGGPSSGSGMAGASTAGPTLPSDRAGSCASSAAGATDGTWAWLALASAVSLLRVIRKSARS